MTSHSPLVLMNATLNHPQLMRTERFPTAKGTHILCHRFLVLFYQSSGCLRWRTWVQRAWRKVQQWRSRCLYLPCPDYAQEHLLLVEVDLLPLVLNVPYLSEQAQTFLQQFDFLIVKQHVAAQGC